MTGEKRKDSIYRAIVVLMALDVVMGAGIAAIGYAVIESDAIALAGAGLATCGIVLLVFFALLGSRSGD
jgi:hypothetical protein